jgi:hypothetical protein
MEKVFFNDLTIGVAIPMTRSRTMTPFLSDPVPLLTATVMAQPRSVALLRVDGQVIC